MSYSITQIRHETPYFKVLASKINRFMLFRLLNVQGKHSGKYSGKVGLAMTID